MREGRFGIALAAVAALGLATLATAQSNEGVKQIERLVKASGNPSTPGPCWICRSRRRSPCRRSAARW